MGRAWAVTWALDQIVPVKTAVRSLPAIINRVPGGGEAVVLTRRGEPQVVLVSVTEYERLMAREAAQKAGRRDQ